jgi:serine/threonine-protein kinase
MSPQSDTPTKLGEPAREPRTGEERLAELLGDQFELLGPLGSGGMGTVYKARFKKFDQVVAIKVVRSTAGDDSNAVKRLKIEAQALAALKHDSIVRVFHLQLLDQFECALVMEYVSGKDLAQVIEEEGSIDSARCRNLFTQCAQALAHAHSNGVVHRDLKPGNILITTEPNGSERAKILDFGLAKLAEAGDQKLTRTGAVMGSPAYMSPEQCQALPIDARSDIYSLGCVFYHAITGNAPFSGDTTFEVLYQHANNRVPPMNSADVALDNIIAKCTEPAVDDRFFSAGELVDALHLPNFRAAMKSSAQRSLKLRVPMRKLVVATGALGVAFAGAVGLFLASERNTSTENPADSLNYIRVMERLTDLSVVSAAPSPELTAVIKQNEKQWLHRGGDFMDVALPYYNAWNRSHQPEMKKLALEFYRKAIEQFHRDSTPSMFEAPRIACLLLDEKDVRGARNVLEDELKWSQSNTHSYDQTALEVKTYIDLLAIDSLTKDEANAVKLRRIMRRKFPSEKCREIFEEYMERDVLIMRAIQKDPKFKI